MARERRHSDAVLSHHLRLASASGDRYCLDMVSIRGVVAI